MEWVTTTQLLDELKFSNDSVAWKTFTDHFYPVITAFAKKTGLSSTDADDVAQETIVTFLKLYRQDKYHREKGHLSHWIYGVTRNVIRDYLKKRPKEFPVSENTTQTSFWASVPDENKILETWNTEWQRKILMRCLSRAQSDFDEKTFKAFDMYAMQHISIEKVSQYLKITPNAVYVAKSRVLMKIRELKKHYMDQ
jgi:RNA polymerase sigma-70 factor (ECF subfamily)